MATSRPSWAFINAFHVPPEPAVGWTGTTAFVAAGHSLARSRTPELRAALTRWTTRLAELGGDPLSHDWSRFRPLRLSREEDWSDWPRAPDRDLDDRSDGRNNLRLPPGRCVGARVEREVAVEDFRLDLQIQWRDGSYSHVEVKVGDLALTKTWPTAQAHRRHVGGAACTDFILLPRGHVPEWDAVVAADPEAKSVVPLTWHGVARAIRTTLATPPSEPTAWRAWAVAYLGAIHHRLLGHPRIDLARIERLGVDVADLLHTLEDGT